MSAESTFVYADRIETLTSVETTASDEWRAAIELHGELDVANAHVLRAELARHLEAGRNVIRVDAGDVDFIDSTALGAIITASERCRQEHGSLILTNVPPRMWRLLMLAGLEQVLLVDTASSAPRADTA